MKKIGFIFLIFPLLVSAQSENVNNDNRGIHFEDNLGWSQLLQKAKMENKFIFVDCYTTWCLPCKQMEKEVYPQQLVGDLYNAQFISVKMQMDTSKKDDEAIKNKYADAHAIEEGYKVTAFPTYLFFTPDGKILNRSMGAKSADEFLKLGEDVLNPEHNYYAVLAQFQQGKTSASQTSWLARRALLLGDTAASQKIAKDYVAHLNKDSLLTKANIEFMREFTKSTNERGFRLFYDHSDSIDKIMGDDIYAQQFVQGILLQETVLPQIAKADVSGKKPNWDKMKAQIKKQYNGYYADRVITAERCSYALKYKDTLVYTKWLVLYMEKFGSKTNKGLMPSLTLNNYAWAVFLNSNNKEELQSALGWSGRAILMYPTANWMDTYANILYKLGRREEALMWQETAVKLSPGEKDFEEDLAKMKNNEPTWKKD